MDDIYSVAYPMTVGNASIAAPRDASRSLVRWVVLGAASLVLFVLAAAHSGSVGAATPAPSNGTYCINYFTCYSVPASTPTYIAPATTVAPAATSSTGYPPYTLIDTYPDARYCGGFVSVVTDASGNLIDVCPGTNQRIIPFFADNSFAFAPGIYGANFINPNYQNGYNGNIAFNGCNVNFNCGAFNAAPAGGTFVGGVYYYNDNRFCGDGKIALVPNRGYYCQNGGALANGVNTVNCGNFFVNGCGIWRGYEADAAPAAPVVAHAAVAPAAAVVAPAAAAAAPAAPVVAPAAAVVAPAAPVVAPAAPVSAKTATALNAPQAVQVDPTERR